MRLCEVGYTKSIIITTGDNQECKQERQKWQQYNQKLGFISKKDKQSVFPSGKQNYPIWGCQSLLLLHSSNIVSNFTNINTMHTEWNNQQRDNLANA